MVKTRSRRMMSKKRKNKTMSKTHNMFITSDERTFCSLQKWYEHMFEHLGWIVLAHEHGIYEKVHHYKSSLYRLEKALKHKIHEIYDKDKKHDLMIMHYNLQCLIRHTNKDFP